MNSTSNPVVAAVADASGEMLAFEPRTTPPTSLATSSDAERDLAAIYDAFGIGIKARSLYILMECISNALRRFNCLSAIERTFFMVPTEPEDDDDEPGEECLLNWGHDPEQYVATFREALQTIASRASGQGQAGAVVDPEMFLDEGLADVQDESGINTYYSKGAVLECIAAALASRNESPAASLQSLGGDAGVSAENARLREALQFYADGNHFAMHNSDAWDTVSGEPANFWEDESNTATVEDGSVAKMALSLTSTEKSDGIDEYEFSELATEHSEETRYDTSHKPHEFVFTTTGLHRLISELKSRNGVVRDMPKYIGDVEWESGNSTLPAAPKAAEKSGRSE